MNNIFIQNTFRFLGLILFQIIILNEIELHGYFTPLIYPLFILLLPFETPPALLLLLGFITGLIIDIEANTLGVHAAATVFLAYVRPFIIQLNAPRGGYEPEYRPTLRSMGIKWLLVYVLIGISIHSLIYYFLDVFSFNNIGLTFFKIIASTIISLILILLHQFLFYNSKN